MAMQRKTSVRLPPEVNRILYVRNLPYKISGEEMYDIFGKYGAIRQIRVGNTPEPTWDERCWWYEDDLRIAKNRNLADYYPTSRF
uniref:Putative splicing factor 3b n=1 Tax=Ixodes ricinus TaxID=34613 RepID=V5IHZ9_IXORI